MRLLDLVRRQKVAVRVAAESSMDAGTSITRAFVNVAFIAPSGRLGAVLHDPPQFARLGVGGLPGAGMKLGLRHRGTLILSA